MTTNIELNNPCIISKGVGGPNINGDIFIHHLAGIQLLIDFFFLFYILYLGSMNINLSVKNQITSNYILE